MRRYHPSPHRQSLYRFVDGDMQNKGSGLQARAALLSLSGASGNELQRCQGLLQLFHVAHHASVVPEHCVSVRANTFSPISTTKENYSHRLERVHSTPHTFHFPASGGNNGRDARFPPCTPTPAAAQF